MDVVVDNVRGVCEVSGRGPPLMLFCSPLARVEPYRPTAEALARSFRVHMVGFPGSGPGEHLAEPWTVERYAEWAAGLIETLGLDRPLVIGHSHGTATAVVLASRFPERVGQLVIADGTGTGHHPRLETYLGALWDIGLEFDLVRREWQSVVGNAFRHTRNFRRLVRESLSVDVRPYARRVQIPTLIAWGRRDYTLPVRHAEAYRECLPNAQMYVCDEGSHNWLITRAEEFAEVVASFANPESLITPNSDQLFNTVGAR